VISSRTIRVINAIVVAGLLFGTVACHHARQPPYVSITSDAVEIAVPLPACRPGSPAAFTHRHDASVGLDAAESWGRLLVCVSVADPVEPAPAQSFVSIRRGGPIHAAALQPSGLFLADSLPSGVVVLHVRDRFRPLARWYSRPSGLCGHCRRRPRATVPVESRMRFAVSAFALFVAACVSTHPSITPRPCPTAGVAELSVPAGLTPRLSLTCQSSHCRHRARCDRVLQS
jgi:hypothetical protein